VEQQADTQHDLPQKPILCTASNAGVNLGQAFMQFDSLDASFSSWDTPGGFTPCAITGGLTPQASLIGQALDCLRTPEDADGRPQLDLSSALSCDEALMCFEELDTSHLSSDIGSALPATHQGPSQHSTQASASHEPPSSCYIKPGKWKISAKGCAADWSCTTHDQHQRT